MTNRRRSRSVAEGSRPARAHVLDETVGDSDEVARTGGDALSALLLQAEDELAVGIALRLKRTAREVALLPEDAVDAKALLCAADRALYNTKDRAGIRSPWPGPAFGRSKRARHGLLPPPGRPRSSPRLADLIGGDRGCRAT